MKIIPRPLFWLFLRLGYEVMDPSFIHGYEATQIISFIVVKHRRIFDWNISRRSFCSIVCKCGTHLAHSFLMSKFSVNMRYTALFEMPTMSASSCTFSPRLSNTILLIFSTISVVVTSFGRALWFSSWQLVRPRLNFATQYFIVVNEGADAPKVESSSALILDRDVRFRFNYFKKMEFSHVLETLC